MQNGELVSYAVDEGIGLFNPESGTNITFGTSAALVTGTGSPLDEPSRFFNSNRFFVMQPVAGRPHLNSIGQYAVTKPDGVDEVAFFSFGNGELCVVYALRSGDVPQGVCEDITDQLSLASTPSPSPTTPRLPETGARCSVPTDTTADAAHTIRLLVGRNSIEPSSLSVEAGERYVVTLVASDSKILHTLLLTNGSGQVAPDGNGAVLCLSGVDLATNPVTTVFTAPIEGGVIYLTDMIQPHVRVKVTVELPSNPPSTLAPDVAGLTPSVSLTQAPPIAPSQTAVPITVTPAP